MTADAIQTFTLPALATSARGVVSKLWVDRLHWRFRWSVMWDLGQHPEQGAGHDDRTGIPQRRSGLPLGIHLGRAIGAQRQVMGGP
jgi:hypothetical protein